MIHDITPPVTRDLAVWPGDTPPAREVLLDMARGDSLTLSTLRATVHLGCHADAPSHYGADAPSIEQRPLTPYIGPCQLIHIDAPRGKRLSPDSITVPISEQRILLATGSYPDPRAFNEDFAALSPELIDALHGQGVTLIGIDTPSVDLFHSKELPSHQAFLKNDMCILEGLVLKQVPPGTYELIALPLPLAGFDASPVRAILRDLQPPTTPTH